MVVVFSNEYPTSKGNSGSNFSQKKLKRAEKGVVCCLPPGFVRSLNFAENCNIEKNFIVVNKNVPTTLGRDRVGMPGAGRNITKNLMKKNGPLRESNPGPLAP